MVTSATSLMLETGQKCVEHYDVTVKLTFDHLDIKCHHFHFISLSIYPKWVIIRV